MAAPLVIFAVSLLCLGLFSWNHLGQQSSDPHFIFQADAFLHGQIELTRTPPHGNDWASYSEFQWRSGQVVRGVWFNRDDDKFITLSGEMLILDREERAGAREVRHHFVSFPPAPAVLMMPFVAWQGYDFNDVWFTLFFGALNLALVYVLLRRLSLGGRSLRSRSLLGSGIRGSLLGGLGGARLGIRINDLLVLVPEGVGLAIGEPVVELTESGVATLVLLLLRHGGRNSLCAVSGRSGGVRPPWPGGGRRAKVAPRSARDP